LGLYTDGDGQLDLNQIAAVVPAQES
jgi:hypothetical protein